ncbi:ankyrin repeat domain-containing protein [Streptomyces sp. NPDC005828]|uniref:ankyrin repeat domain-containing protein n=1 Tax=Streptomyces sp. NPDC005828 TaxID=3157071 RepID=UPI0033EF4326
MGVGKGTSNAADGESALISAVRAGDTGLVRILLHGDSDPDLRDAAFCLAVRMRAGHIAQLLLQYGADPGQSGQEGLLPLSEAVDSGSPALFEALLDHEIRRSHPESELLEARDLARRWHETGVEAELRRRTGSRDAIVRTPVQDDEYNSVDEFTLGGMTVRDGHGAILTYVEELLGVRTSFDELMDRAWAHAGQENHTTWSRVAILLAGRCDQATWTAAAALRTNPDPLVRKTACHTVARGGDNDPAFVEAMAAALDDTDRLVQLAAVYGLAVRDDERCVEAALRLGPPQRGSLEEEGYLDAVWRYERRRDNR